MIQIRNVPEALHREIKVRAAREGMSMSDWLMREISKVVKRPSRAEVLARIRARGPLETPIDSVALIRSMRDGDER